MSAEIVNLRGARKRKARADKERVAQDNRVRFGLAKAERQGAENERDKQARRLDGARLTPGTDGA